MFHIFHENWTQTGSPVLLAKIPGDPEIVHVHGLAQRSTRPGCLGQLLQNSASIGHSAKDPLTATLAVANAMPKTKMKFAKEGTRPKEAETGRGAHANVRCVRSDHQEVNTCPMQLGNAVGQIVLSIKSGLPSIGKRERGQDPSISLLHALRVLRCQQPHILVTWAHA